MASIKLGVIASTDVQTPDDGYVIFFFDALDNNQPKYKKSDGIVYSMADGGGSGSSGTTVKSFDNAVISILNTPPSTINLPYGSRYLISSSSTGDWIGSSGKIAQWNNQWKYTSPTNAHTIKVISDPNCVYSYEGEYPSGGWRRHGFLESALGQPNIGSWSDGLYDFSSLPSVDAFYTLNNKLKVLNKLIPSAPAGLSNKALALATAGYNAYRQNTGVLVVCFDSIPQSNIIADFYDADSGTIAAYIDGVSQGSKILTTGDNSGTYGSLIITNDRDANIPYPSIASGFYKVLSAKINPTTLGIGSHTYQMKHSVTGDSRSISFDIDDPSSSHSVTWNASISYPTISRWISGVPSLAVGQQLTVNLTLANFVSSHYAAVIGRVSNTRINTIDLTPSKIYNSGESDTRNVTITIIAGNTVESIVLSAIAYNSKSVASSASTKTIQSRIDTISVENRVRSGSGQYPTDDGGAYDSTHSLITSGYTEELQLLSGVYRRITGNYTANLPTAGYDYSTDPNTDYRYVEFDTSVHGITLSNNVGFTINIIGSTGITGVESAGIRIYTKIQGSTGWLNANSSYQGTGNPTNDGEPCMMYSQSTATSKRCTLGVVRSGNLKVRIGLPYGSNITFGSITITNVS